MKLNEVERDQAVDAAMAERQEIRKILNTLKYDRLLDGEERDDLVNRYRLRLEINSMWLESLLAD